MELNEEGTVVTKCQSRHRQPSYIPTTVAIYFGNIGLGCAMSAYSPLAVDFATKYGTTLDKIAILFTIIVCSYLTGGLMTSFIYKWMNRQVGVILALTGLAISMYLTPHCPTVTSLGVLAVLLGFSIALYDAAQTVWIIEMWQAQSPLYVQAQYFFLALGGLIPGVLMVPFLTIQTPASPNSSSNFWIPFTAIGLLMTTGAGLQLFLYIFNPYIPPPPHQEHPIQNKPKQPKEITKILNSTRTKLIILAAIFLGFQQGMGQCSSQFISTFGQFGSRDLTQCEGSKLFTLFIATYTMGRGVGIVASLKLSPFHILVVNLTFISLANALLLFASVSPWILWGGAGLLGFGFSTIYPTFCTYIQTHLQFTNGIASTFLVSGGAVGAVYPLIIGNQIENEPNFLIYLNLITLVLTSAALVFIAKITCRAN